MIDRRGFLGAMFAACAAPAIVRADSLMRIVPTDTVILPANWAQALEYNLIENQFLTCQLVTREALRILGGITMFTDEVNRTYLTEMSDKPIGSMIRVSSPSQYARRTN